jgi:hypothetical protein
MEVPAVTIVIPAGLYKLLAEDREVTVGLQARMKAMADRTFHALSIGFQTNLLHLDSDLMRQVIPGRKTPPVTHVTEEVKIILNAAKRVGQAFPDPDDGCGALLAVIYLQAGKLD